MEQREQQIITNCEELQGWRIPEGEEQDYIKGFLMKQLNAVRTNLPWVYGIPLFLFMVSAYGCLYSIVLFIEEFAFWVTSLEKLFVGIVLVLFSTMLAVVFGKITLHLIKDTERKECVSLLYNGNMEVLDVSITKVYPSSHVGFRTVEVMSGQGQKYSQPFTCYSYEGHHITEGLLVKVVRENAKKPNFWVIPVYIQNGKTYKIGMEYLRKYRMKRKKVH